MCWWLETANFALFYTLHQNYISCSQVRWELRVLSLEMWPCAVWQKFADISEGRASPSSGSKGPYSLTLLLAPVSSLRVPALSHILPYYASYSTLNMEAICSSPTSINFYQNTRCHIPESSVHSHWREKFNTQPPLLSNWQQMWTYFRYLINTKASPADLSPYLVPPFKCTHFKKLHLLYSSRADQSGRGV
jgi:hypothetical protein